MRTDVADGQLNFVLFRWYPQKGSTLRCEWRLIEMDFIVFSQHIWSGSTRLVEKKGETPSASPVTSPLNQTPPGEKCFEAFA